MAFGWLRVEEPNCYYSCHDKEKEKVPSHLSNIVFVGSHALSFLPSSNTFWVISTLLDIFGYILGNSQQNLDVESFCWEI